MGIWELFPRSFNFKMCFDMLLVCGNEAMAFFDRKCAKFREPELKSDDTGECIQ